MKTEQRQLTKMPNPYVAKAMQLGGATAIVTASEGYGPCVRFSGPGWEPAVITEEPGGCLDITAAPGEEAIFMIGGCFPGYDFHGAGVYLVSNPEGGGTGSGAAGGLAGDAGSVTAGGWRQKRLFDLPFAHRLQAFPAGQGAESGPTLVATSIAQTKASPQDWARPGAVFAVDFPNSLDAPTPIRPILAELHKNHGFIVREEQGKSALYITGTEGLFRAQLPATVGESWRFERVLSQEISELFYIDLDGDGRDELVTIEPFHGHRLVVYKLDGDEASVWREHEISYGHGLWCGPIGGIPSILVGNRSGSKNLELLQLDGNQRLSAHTVAEGSGTAQVAVLHESGADLIFATNQEREEVALYTIAG